MNGRGVAMSTVSHSRLIDASADRLWQIMTDLPARAGWLCTVDRIEVLTPGRFAPGTSWRESRTLPDGATLTEELLVREADPPHRFVLASSGVGVDYRTTYQFRPVTGRCGVAGTDVTVVQEATYTVRYGRVLAAVFGGLAARAVENALRRDLDDLAAAAEPPAATGPAEAA